MEKRASFLPEDLRSRIGYAAGTAIFGGLLLGFFGSGTLAWNTWGYWVFVAGAACLSFAICKYID